ncbi:hypothetical protein B7486_65600, partial [cyanobacterium TDX16]
GVGAAEGRAWAGAPVAVRSLELVPPLIHPGDDVCLRVDVEVLRPVDRLVVVLDARARVPGLDLVPETSVSAVSGRIELTPEQRVVGRTTIEAVVASFPASGGKFEWVVALLDRDDDAPLAQARATLEVSGPNEAHAMAAIDGAWRLTRTGATEGSGA